MKKKKLHFNLSLSSADISAIVCALPLVTTVEADTPAQDDLNAACCNSAANKLLCFQAQTLTANEVRVISFAISCAVLLLSGKTNELLPEIDAEWKADLSKHFFTLNRLDPIFQDFLDQLWM